MQLTKKFEIKSKQNLVDFLNSQNVGRVATIDINGFPQIIPMNFVYIPDISNIITSYNNNENKDYSNNSVINGLIYMHSHPFGEKIENIKRNSKVGFEVDQHVCFLPSYYFHPTDASQADTLYISIVIKGRAILVTDNKEKAIALNALMEKYQKEGKYEKLTSTMRSVNEVCVIRLEVLDIHGKYKIGQHWPQSYRLKMAKSIILREGVVNAKPILEIMGLKLSPENIVEIVKEPIM